MAARELPSVRARTLCSRPILPARTHSPAFAPTIVDVRRVRAWSHVSARLPASVPGVHARSHASALGVRTRPHQSVPGPTRPLLESAPDPTHPRLESAPGPTRPHPLARVRAQRGHAFTSGRTRATSARPQSFPVGAPYSCVRLQQYINPFALPHKSLCS
jgi:hypothetical protein